LYEKLLLSIFDVLDEGKLAEELEEILELLKSTWRILGITETIHHTCYAWVLFRQFVMTREHPLLKHAIEQLNKVPLKEERGQQERMHLKSLYCKVENEEGSQELTFLQSFITPIQKWADKQLADYHLHFSESLAMMENVVSISMLARRLLQEEHGSHVPVTDGDKIESYVSSSIKSAFVRILQDVETMSNATDEHPLALLGEETKKLLKRDATIFMPVLSQWNPQGVVVSASLLHKLYGSKLKPFLNSVEQLTEDVVLVFPAADNLEEYVMDLISSCGGGEAEYSLKKLAPYKIETISGTLVLRWVNAQLSRILGWVERAIQQERWEPVSMQQRHGSSIVEVYRIVEETVDQFFALKIPMRSGEMNSLFRGIDNALQVYAKHVVDNLANKDDIIPPVPILTRYRREAKKKLCEMEQKHVFDGLRYGEKAQRDLLADQIVGVNSQLLQVALQTIETPSDRWQLSEFLAAYNTQPAGDVFKVSKSRLSNGDVELTSSKLAERRSALISNGKVANILVLEGTKMEIVSDSEGTDNLVQRLVEMESHEAMPLVLVCPANTIHTLKNLMADNDYFGFDPEKVWLLEEEKLPVVSSSSRENNKRKILMKSPWEVLQTPVGSGGVISLLSSHNILVSLGAMGVEYIEISSVDQKYVGGGNLLGLVESSEAYVGIKTFDDINVIDDDFYMVFSMYFATQLTKRINGLLFDAVLRPNDYVELVDKEWVDVSPSSHNSYEFRSSIYTCLKGCPLDKIRVIEIVD
nr:protein unc-13 homolog isoform X1 [Tanacetum cinerariifolium]